MSATNSPGLSSSSINARVDLAHVNSPERTDPSSPDLSQELLESIAGLNPERNIEQFRSQAAELADQICAQQDSLDERESELNARLAKLENRIRAQRVYKLGRDANYDSPVKQRLSQRPDSEVNEVLQETTRRWREAIYDNVHSAEGVKPSGRQTSSATAKSFAESETVDFETPDFEAADKATPLQPDDSREVALQRMQHEVSELHREALEMRLATEQLWAEMSDRTPSGELMQSLAKLRSRLAEHFELESQIVQQKKADLEKLRNDTTHKVLELRTQRERLRAWVEREHEDIERKAALLAQREREISEMRQPNFDHLT